MAGPWRLQGDLFPAFSSFWRGPHSWLLALHHLQTHHPTAVHPHIASLSPTRLPPSCGDPVMTLGPPGSARTFSVKSLSCKAACAQLETLGHGRLGEPVTLSPTASSIRKSKFSLHSGFLNRSHPCPCPDLGASTVFRNTTLSGADAWLMLPNWLHLFADLYGLVSTGTTACFRVLEFFFLEWLPKHELGGQLGPAIWSGAIRL